jgi:hypothetical protein
VFCAMSCGRAPAGLKGFLIDFWRVGDGGIATSSSSSVSDVIKVGCHLSRGSPAAAKMFPPVLGAFTPPFRRGDRDNEAIEIGDGSAISMSIGVPANIVCALPNGVRVLFFRTLAGSGESIDNSVISVVEGNSPSALVLTDDNGMSF